MNKKSPILSPYQIECIIQQRRKDHQYLHSASTKMPIGFYKAMLLTIEEDVIFAVPDYGSNMGNMDTWVWCFKITHGKYRGRIIRGMSSRSLHETSKAYRWCSAINRRRPKVGQAVDLTNMFDKRCGVYVGCRPNGFSVVDDVMTLNVLAERDKKRKKHIARHKLLHKHLDELLADCVSDDSKFRPSKNTVMDLMVWSCEQTKNPTGEQQ